MPHLAKGAVCGRARRIATVSKQQKERSQKEGRDSPCKLQRRIRIRDGLMHSSAHSTFTQTQHGIPSPHRIFGSPGRCFQFPCPRSQGRRSDRSDRRDLPTSLLAYFRQRQAPGHGCRPCELSTSCLFPHLCLSSHPLRREQAAQAPRPASAPRAKSSSGTFS